MPTKILIVTYCLFSLYNFNLILAAGNMLCA